MSFKDSGDNQACGNHRKEESTLPGWAGRVYGGKRSLVGGSGRRRRLSRESRQRAFKEGSV